MEESKVLLVGLGYFFITSEGVKRRDELAFELTLEGEEESLRLVGEAKSLNVSSSGV